MPQSDKAPKPGAPAPKAESCAGGGVWPTKGTKMPCEWPLGPRHRTSLSGTSSKRTITSPGVGAASSSTGVTLGTPKAPDNSWTAGTLMRLGATCRGDSPMATIWPAGTVIGVGDQPSVLRGSAPTRFMRLCSKPSKPSVTLAAAIISSSARIVPFTASNWSNNCLTSAVSGKRPSGKEPAMCAKGDRHLSVN